MPNNWKTYKLEDIASFSYGKMPKKKLLGKGKYPTFSGYKYQYQYSEFNVLKDDLIVVARGVGGTGDVKLVKEKSYLTNLSIKIELDQSILINRYFYYKFLLNNLKYLDSGSAQSQLTINDLSKVEVKIPPLPEQKAIANILSAIDDKIENNLAINKTLEDMAMALYKHWFVDFGPFQDGEFIDSELGPIPKGWEVKRLDEVCNKIYSGGTPKTKEPAYWNGNIPWLSSGETRNKFVVETDKFITKLGLKKSSSKMAYIGNTVIASAGQGKTRGQTSYLFIDTSINQSVIVLEANEEIIHKETLFLDLSTRYDEFRMISDSFSTRGSLTTKLLSSQIKLPLPNIKLQTDFNNQITKYFNSIESNIKENQSLTQLRDTLLPKLISGEVRLKEFKDQIESVL